MNDMSDSFNPDDLRVSWNSQNDREDEPEDTIISPIRKQYQSDSDDEQDEVKPPTIENVKNSPRVKLMTPIRKKNMDIPRVDDIDGIYINRSPLRHSPIRRSPVRTPSPAISVTDDEEINEHVLGLVNNPLDVDYSNQPNHIKQLCIEAFRTKYANLKLNNKGYEIMYPEGKKLNKIHKTYHGYVKDIFVSLNLGQIQIGYIVGIMGLEIFAIKILGLPMAGFTRLELKRMYKYHSMMIEFGHTMYAFGGGSSSLEWRMGSTFMWNIFLFLGVKMLSKYIGGDSMIEVIRDTVDQIVENPVSRDDVENGNATGNADSGNNDMGNLFNMFGGGGGGGSEDGMADLIANMGTTMTENMEKNNNTSSQKKNKKRFIFEE